MMMMTIKRRLSMMITTMTQMAMIMTSGHLTRFLDLKKELSSFQREAEESDRVVNDFIKVNWFRWRQQWGWSGWLKVTIMAVLRRRIGWMPRRSNRIKTVEKRKEMKLHDCPPGGCAGLHCQVCRASRGSLQSLPCPGWSRWVGLATRWCC